MHQKAVLWPFSHKDEQGMPVVDAPVSIDVRWVTKRMESVDRQGNTISLDGMAVVDRKIDVESQMWLAPRQDEDPIEQWYGTGSAGDDSEIMRVALYNEIPDMDGREVRRTVGLRRFQGNPST